MYINKCTKCGKEFETKNPKRVICPDCLYPDKSSLTSSSGEEKAPQYPKNFSFGPDNDAPRRPSHNKENRPYNGQRNNNGERNNNNNNGGHRPFNKGGKKPFNKYQNNNRKGFSNQRKPKPMILPREVIMQIETLYKKMLPLPNHDAHEVIANEIGQEPKKVFSAINAIRQKMMLPRISYPRRKLALTPDQLTAVKNLYEPLLPLPPIGCHKIIAAQLHMDEWRVHVGIGLIRKQMGMDRWNPEREDAPEEFKKKSE